MSSQHTMDRIKPVINQLGSEELHSVFTLLQERIDYPESFVTLLGETSSGKSSLVNGLLGQDVLHVSSKPTTGTIVELNEFDGETAITPYALLKNAKLRRLSPEAFSQETIQPSEDVLRVRLNIPEMPLGLQGMRLFDTPGYGSIHQEHEEVLKEFIPNSDVIIYVVNYRVGIGSNDAEFLQYIERFLQDNIKFFLVINRVPSDLTSSDVRIKEILNYAQDLLHSEIEHFIVSSITGDGVKMPRADDLWEAVRLEVQSESRKKHIEEVLQDYQVQLLQEAIIPWQKRLTLMKVNEEDIALLQQTIFELENKKIKAKDLIDQTFERLNRQVPQMFEQAKENMDSFLEAEIMETNKWTSSQETVGLIHSHILPRQERIQREVITDFLEVELDKLNNQLEELVNEAIIDFRTKIESISGQFDPIMKNISKLVLQKTSDGALQTFLSIYGGRGGAGAGVANLAKKGLKKVGEVVGKKFSRETHNALASFLKRIGATSARNITIAATILIDSIFYVIEAKRWQGRLIKETKKGTNQWEQNTCAFVIDDLKTLKKTNNENMDNHFDDFINIINTEDFNPVSKLEIGEIEHRISEIEELILQIKKDQVSI